MLLQDAEFSVLDACALFTLLLPNPSPAVPHDCMGIHLAFKGPLPDRNKLSGERMELVLLSTAYHA